MVTIYDVKLQSSTPLKCWSIEDKLLKGEISLSDPPLEEVSNLPLDIYIGCGLS